MTDSNMIEVENLSERYGHKLTVDGLSFVVQPGIVTAAWRLRRADA
jgi:ABC-type multidrug transport system ATPase subunit